MCYVYYALQRASSENSVNMLVHKALRIFVLCTHYTHRMHKQIPLVLKTCGRNYVGISFPVTNLSGIHCDKIIYELFRNTVRFLI